MKNTKDKKSKMNIKGLSTVDPKIKEMILRANGTIMAGVGKINSTLPLGAPLGGYNHGSRAAPYFPIPCLGEYTTWMMPNQGTLNTLFTKALIIINGNQQFAIVTNDAIGSDSAVNQMAIEYATAQGFPIPLENIIFSSSHTHSGPAAVTEEFLWSVAPAMDLVVPELQEYLAMYEAEALIQAYNSLQPAVVGIGMTNLTGVTTNRRASISPYVQPWTIDPHLGVIRVDTVSGNIIGTLWNFAIHGVCYGPDNMLYSGDIMGVANTMIEEAIGGVALFMNGDAGDIDPGPGMCNSAPNFNGSTIMANTVVGLRSNITTYSTIDFEGVTQYVPFGPTNLNATFQRFDNCSTGGPLDVCTLCRILDCDLNAHMYSNWIENDPRFTAFRFTINDVNTVITSMPGEALVELGWWVRNDTKDLNFDITFLAGYSNSHMGYFATPNEYDIGGYESQLTLWGIETATMVREGSYGVCNIIKPKPVFNKPIQRK